MDEDELVKLGTKNCQGEVEKFIQANTQELAKDKWLCPLSGKKFKGPDFIKKHIFNKHGEKVNYRVMMVVIIETIDMVNGQYKYNLKFRSMKSKKRLNISTIT